MGYAILLVVLSALALLLASSSGRGNDPAPTDGKPPVTNTSDAASVKRSEVRDRLLKLAEQPPPEKLSPGAMCYSRVAPPERTDYLCPGCGEKTLYAVADAGGDARLFKDMEFLQWELPACRRLVEQIKGVHVQLDESQFCAKCFPDLKGMPKLVLIVGYAGEGEPHRVEGVTIDDIKLLHEFFTGKDKHIAEQGAETPLKDHLARLSELLGVELEATE